MRSLDYGRDNYAAVTYSDLGGRIVSQVDDDDDDDDDADDNEDDDDDDDDYRRYQDALLQGWMNSWGYANKIPTSVWRGSMTVPRLVWLSFLFLIITHRVSPSLLMIVMKCFMIII